MDLETRRKKQQALMAELIERKIRLHAQRLYDQRGKAEGRALEDWVQAESEVLENSILAPLYLKTRSTIASERTANKELSGGNPEFESADSTASEVGV